MRPDTRESCGQELGRRSTGAPGDGRGGFSLRNGSNAKGDGCMQVPVIDLGPYLAGEAGARERTAEAVGEASESLGFFFIVNHGVPQTLIDGVFAETERFHSLPLERKMAVKVVDKIVGYLPLGGQTQRTSVYGKSQHPDRSASFYIRQEFGPEHPDRLAGKAWVFDNRWPGDLPGFRETTLGYFAAMSELALRMLPLHSVALGLGPDYLSSHDAFRPPTYNLRLLHYPPRDALAEGQFGIGPHTDYSYCTLLAQAKLPGLEILTRTGEWVQAPALEGHILVNNGDMCRRWTNDRFRSAPHRVINTTGQTRYSIPFFVGPRVDVRLCCLPTCQGPDNSPRYPPMSFGEYLAEINRRNYDLPAPEKVGAGD